MSKLKATDLTLTYDSDYLTDAYYQALQEDRRAARDFGPALDLDLNAECLALLSYEARLLDSKQYDRWLDLYTKDAIYWIPYDDEADIRTSVNMMFDDRRRLEDRVLRLISRFAHTLVPERRFQHLVSNVEAWNLPDGRRRVLASQAAHEYRPGGPVSTHLFRSDHTLVCVEGEWKIAVKRCVLLNLDAAVKPPTLL